MFKEMFEIGMKYLLDFGLNYSTEIFDPKKQLIEISENVTYNGIKHYSSRMVRNAINRTDKMDFLNQNKNKFWNEFLDNNGNCPYNYGAIWQNSFGRNQMDSLLNSLQNEPSSRQNVITIWNGSKDGLDSPKQANVPCITQFQVSISNNKLYLHTYWRSEDLGLGFVNDVPAFAMLQMFLAQKLGLEVGELIWTVHNAHIYENQFENVKEMIYRHNELEQDIGYLILPYDNKEEMVEYYYTRYNCLYNIEAFNIINFNPISFSLNELPAHCFDICYQQPNLDKAQIVLAEIFGIIKSKYNPLAKLAKMEIVK